jgi:RNA polymerase sigma factor (sigma-70 family)
MTQKRDEYLKECMNEYGSIVLSTAMRILKNVQDAEDVFQNTFVKAYCINKVFNDQNHIKAWLIRVTVNDCLSRLRSGWKKKVVLCDLPQELIAWDNDNSSDIIRLLQKIPRIYRRAIWLYYWAGYKTHEIAEMTDVKPATVRTRLKRARVLLKADIQKG